MTDNSYIDISFDGDSIGDAGKGKTFPLPHDDFLEAVQEYCSFYEYVPEGFEDQVYSLLSSGKSLRLSRVRELFKGNIDQSSISLLIKLFRTWKNTSEYLLLFGENSFSGEQLRLAVKCSKRGNDVFSRRLDQKLGFLGELEGIELFKPEDFDSGKKIYSNLLFVTLTYNSNRCCLKEAWKSYQSEWNLWITNLRNKYGSIDVLKFSEAFPGEKGRSFGYPHIHAVLLFKEARFQVFPSLEKTRSGEVGLVYRIQEKDALAAQGKWHSFIDVKAISSGRSLGGYLRKHTKNCHYGDSAEALVTQSLLWLYRKQTFSMSSGFRKSLEFITNMHVSKVVSCQVDLFGVVCDGWKWVCYGVVSGLVLNLDSWVWVASVSVDRFQELVRGDSFG